MCNVLSVREEIGVKKGISQGVRALVNALKDKSSTEIHSTIISNPGFELTTIEQVEEILKELS